MDATRGPLEELQDELDMWLHCCDICLNVASSPVAMTCGHLFCRSCLNEFFEGEQERTCLVCTIDLLGETAHSFRIDRIRAPPEPTPQAANSETSIAGNREPAAGTPMRARSSLISSARMVVVQDYLEDGNEHAHNIQLGLSRRVSDLRLERIRELEHLMESVVQMNSVVLEEFENCARDRSRMSSRIVELENPTVHGRTAFARRQRRVGRRITPTPFAVGNDEAAPESVEGRLSTTNNSDAGA